MGEAFVSKIIFEARNIFAEDNGELFICPECGSPNAYLRGHPGISRYNERVYYIPLRCANDHNWWVIFHRTTDVDGSLLTSVRKAVDTFMSYKEYIASPEWKIMSDKAKERAGWRCQLCNKEGNNSTLHTHHRTYENLGHEDHEDLIVLCADCHAKFHDKLEHDKK